MRMFRGFEVNPFNRYLGISWVEGARWFHDTLVDADVAINAMMWQARVSDLLAEEMLDKLLFFCFCNPLFCFL